MLGYALRANPTYTINSNRSIMTDPPAAAKAPGVPSDGSPHARRSSKHAAIGTYIVAPGQGFTRG
jgi:hypothetical protein